MSIEDELREQDKSSVESMTGIERVLDLFANRIAERRHFAAYLNDQPPKNKILFFHGDGGNGKSWLLRLLKERYCHTLLPESWKYVKSLEDGKDFADNYEHAEGSVKCPCAYLDFADDKGSQQPRHAFDGLRMLRKQLGGKSRLKFPLFDYAMALHQTKGLGQNIESIRQLFPAEEAGFADSLVSLLAGTKIFEQAAAVWSLFNKYFGKQEFALYLKRCQVDQSEVERLARLEPQGELFNELPRLFARDLTAAMTAADAPKRVVLLFDTHESFWGTGRHRESVDSYHGQDLWLRRLLLALELKSGIIAVVAGRERPQWSSAPKDERGKETRIPDNYLDAWLVGHLATEDANEYLTKAGISKTALRQDLIRMAQVKTDQIHPLYLGLCGDMALAAQYSGKPLDLKGLTDSKSMQDKYDVLITRLLRYCDQDVTHAVKALAAARTFDRELFFYLGQHLHYHATESAYRQLCQFSFVWPMKDKGKGWYRIHDLLRRAFWRLDEEHTRQANEALEAYYRQQHTQGDTLAIASAIYHAYRLEWQRGLNEWIAEFQRASEHSRHDLCGNLLQLRQEFELTDDFHLADLYRLSGEYSLQLSRHQLAHEELNAAIEMYHVFLQTNPKNLGGLGGRGFVWERLADSHPSLSDHATDQDQYIKAINCYGQALDLAPNHVAILTNLGSTWDCLADLWMRLGDHVTAQTPLTNALNCYRQALELAPNDVMTLNNQGLSQQRLADLHVQLGNHAPAQAQYANALDCYNRALQLKPDHVILLTNQGLAQQKLANLHARLRNHAAAQAQYANALDSYGRAPADVATLTNQSMVWQGLAALYAGLEDYATVQAQLTKALDCCGRALELAPDNVITLNNQARAWENVAELCAYLGNHTTAQAQYAKAIDGYGRALELAPNDVMILNNQGRAWQRLADLQANLSDYQTAKASYRKAFASYDKALKTSPNQPEITANRASAQEALDGLKSQ